MNENSGIPLTRKAASEASAEAVRSAVRGAVEMPTENASSRLAAPPDAPALFEFLKDPAVSAPIYTLPRPLTLNAVRTFIELHEDERARGAGLLFLNFDRDGRIGGYTDVFVWPEWAAGELGGALHPDRQSQGRGGQGAAISFDWMFEALELELICETAALDNVRTARLLDALGFRRMGEIFSARDDGTKRASLVWEITRAEWRAAHPQPLQTP